MAEEEKKEEPKEGVVDAPPAGPKIIMGMPLLIFIFFALNALVMLGGTGYIFWAMMLYKKPPVTNTQVVTEIQKKMAKKILDTPKGGDFFVETYAEMTVNLRSPAGGKPHYCTVEVALACPNERCQNQLKSLKAKVEDTVQTAIAERSFSELTSLETKFRLKHEITQKVNALLKETAIIDVYFQSFVVQ